ncbi:YcbK family protein [Mesorhizobium sp. BR1-1-3]|uniref:YcbK family protein n=1 Tax=unclassified Mesorhizobium TaxID=325217 RepID=UPI001CD1451E|nr:YcbK family protein [Mesorhizobium sp. BR1-1-3]MBZ9886609.1 YcbK family protein [Mesorhizobium sp. BR1-1-3]
MTLKSAGWSLAKGERRAIVAALCSLLLASCTSAGDPAMSVGMPGYNATASDVSAASSGKAIAASDSSDVTTEQTTVMTASDTALPEKVAYVPVSKPGAAFPLTMPAGAETIVGNTPQSLTQQAQTAQQTDAVAQQIAAADGDVAAPKPAAAPAMNNPVYVTAGEMPQAEAPKKKGFLASMFGATPASATPAPLISNARTGEQPPAQAKATPAAAKPIITLASANSTAKPVQLASLGGDSGHITGSDALPGVRQTALFEIKRKSGLDDESDVDLNEDEGPVGGSYQVASAAGMARLAPNGLLKQNESVDVACLKPSLVRVLKTIEGHYGRKMTVTSGYRDPARNRRANGAKNSLHMYCAAADIQVPGVSKWELASYIRSMPGRGGVGTYCHTESVHVDVGPERDWNWRCRRRSGGDG